MDELEVMEKAKELKDLQGKQDDIRLENSMLSEHLSRIVMRKGSLQLHLERLDEEETEKEKDEQEAEDAKRRSVQRSFRIFQDAPAPRATVRFLSPRRESELEAAIRPKPAAGLPMSVEEKCEIVEEECNALTDNVEKIRAENDRVLDDLRAVIREALHGMGENRKEKNSFNREVILLSSVNPKCKIYTEDILRFLEETLRKKRVVRDKLQEKIDLLTMEIMEAELQFSSKKDLKDILHSVDFDQIKIQNVQLNTRIRDRTHELRTIKLSSKKCYKELGNARRKIEMLMQRGIRVRKLLKDRTPQIKVTQDFISYERAQKRKLGEAYVTSLKEEDGPPQPRVMDYIHLRNKVDGLRKEMKTWSGKVEIAELSFNELKKSIQSFQKEQLTHPLVLPKTAVLVSS